MLAVTTGQPARKRRRSRRIGWPVGAADQFDEEVDIRRGGERDGIVEEGRAAEIEAAVAAAARADGDDRDVPPGARGEIVAPTLQQPDQR